MMMLLGSLIKTVVIFILMMAAAHFLSYWSALGLFGLLMAFHVWYRQHYGHWMGDQ